MRVGGGREWLIVVTQRFHLFSFDPGYVAGRGRGMGDLARSQQEGGLAGGGAAGAGERDKGDYSEANYDEFSGYGGALFGGETPYDDDDKEADKIYQAIDDRMDSRRKRRREEKLLATLQKVRAQRPKAGDQFADLKADLQNVSVVSSAPACLPACLPVCVNGCVNEWVRK
jgi:pre-mRNA-processing factor 6